MHEEQEEDGSSSYDDEDDEEIYTDEEYEEGEAELEESQYSDSNENNNNGSLHGKCCTKATVLLVDDIVFNMIPLEQIFNTYGLICDKAHDGVQEVEMYYQNMKKTCCDVRYRIILTDINMPRMDGIEAAERIFQTQVGLRIEKPMLPEIVIVAVTAYDTQQTIDRCEQAGILMCLTKPVKADMIDFLVDKHNLLSGYVSVDESEDHSGRVDKQYDHSPTHKIIQRIAPVN